jgi:hypothetical protein
MTKTHLSSAVCVSLLIPVLAGLPLSGWGRFVAIGQEHESGHQDENKDNDKNKPKDDPCVQLADVRGLARGIEKKCLSGGGSSGIAKADFNGDGVADLAIGVPHEETPTGQPGAGAVNVIYGSKTNGLTTTDTAVPPPQFLSQNAPGIPQFSEAGDSFGSAVVGGDFNRDGFSDLAIGTPFEHFAHNGVAEHGSVTVIYGSQSGLTTDPALRVLPAQIFSIGDLGQSCGIALAASTDSDVPIISGRFFGAALAWGDFNGDGIGDLAVGSPDEPVIPNGPTCKAAGAIGILFGSTDAGLKAAGGQVFTQNTSGVLDTAEEGDGFGVALAAGDFNGDKTTDLAIGVLGEDVVGADTQGFAQIVDAGAVEVLFGVSGSGLTATAIADRFFDERDLFALQIPGGETAGVASAGDQFGSSMAAGDFDGDGLDELAIGAHNRDRRGLADSGVVFVRSFGGANIGVQVWDQTTIFGSQFANFTGSPTEAGDHFGYALAAGDFNADGRKDLAIGVPYEDVLVARGGNTFEHVSNAGEVNVIYGSPAGLSVTGQAPQQFQQDTINIEDSVEAGDEFGKSLTAWNFGRNETRQVCGLLGCITVPAITADLAIGVPYEDVGAIVNAGAVNVIYGCTTCFANFAGLTSVGNKFWIQGLGGPAWGGPEAGDRFGAAIY